MIGDGEAEVEDRDDDRHLVPRDQQPHQPCLEHVGREEGEEHDDQREHQTHVLDTERGKVLLNFLSWVLVNGMHSLAQSRLTFHEISELLCQFKSKYFSYSYQSECTNLHENNKENDALESEEFTEGVDEEVHEEECALHQQHGPVPGQGQLHDGLMWNVMFCWSQLTI